MSSLQVSKVPLSDICTAAKQHLERQLCARSSRPKSKGAALLAALETVVVGQPLYPEFA
jgi:hypothetical protein